MAIIVAGGGTGAASPTFGTIEFLADTAYKTFLARDIPKDHIYYLHPNPPHDADGDSLDDVSALATAANLQYAIETWALNLVDTSTTDSPAQTPLSVYVAAPGASDYFKINGSENVTSSNLDTYFTNLYNGIIGKYGPLNAPTYYPINIILESRQCGTFVNDLTGSGKIPGRFVFSATGDIIGVGANGEDNIQSSGNISFSKYFLTNIVAGQYLGSAWANANQSILNLFSSNQRPRQEGNNNGTANETGDALATSGKYMEFRPTGNARPFVSGVQANQTLTNTSSATLWAVVTDPEGDSRTVNASTIPLWTPFRSSLCPLSP
jgi:hypothetical protein